VGPGKGVSTCSSHERQHDHTFVRSRDRVVFVARELRSAEDVAPHGSYSVAGLDVDDGRRHGRVEATVAGEAAIVDVQDGVVRVGRADADEFALVLLEGFSMLQILRGP
jgi:hypothetical protein